jgi:hypothetical protein
MADQEALQRGRQILAELIETFSELDDSALVELLGGRELDALLTAILDPSDTDKYPNLNEFMLAKKTRATILAQLRWLITDRYAFRGKSVDGRPCYMSPNHFQWFEDGIMFMQGPKRFEGLIGLYRQSGRLSYAFLARDAKAGEELGPEYFEFIDEAETRKRQEQIAQIEATGLHEPLRRLQSLLDARDNEEGRYQRLLMDYPWILGAKYKAIHRHRHLDDRSIPDFTGIRVRDACRDIIEIKPPFTKMFRQDGTLNSTFNDAWNQIEGYLDFARREQGYLYRKGLRFENPKGYLILGFGYTEEEKDQIRIKERGNPAITVLTYEDLRTFAVSTAKWARALVSEEESSCTRTEEES